MQRTICSVFPLEQRTTRNYRRIGSRGGFLTTFILPAAPKGEHVTLRVDDMEELFRFSSDMPSTEMKVYADGNGGVAQDLINSFVGQHVGSAFGGPGIFICTDNDVKEMVEGEMVVTKPATGPSERELAAAIQRQTAWFTWLIMQAHDAWMNGRRGEVRDQHRMAAEWLGKTGYEWMKPPEQSVMTKCPLCRFDIEAGCIICPNCKNVIDQKGFHNWQRISAEVSAEMEKLKAEAVKSKPELAGLELDETGALPLATAAVASAPPQPPPLAVKPQLPGRK